MRDFKGKLAIIIGIWAAVTAAFHLYTAYYGSFEPRVQRATHLFLLLPIVFLAFPSIQSQKEKLPNILDWILATLALTPSLYLILQSETLSRRVELVDKVTSIEYFLGVLVILLILEACRRAVSSIFASLVVISILFLFLAPYLPGSLSSRVYSFDRVVELMFLSGDQGIYGFLTGIGSTVLFVFVLFAAVMIRSGVGQFFMDISVAIAGRFRGGPAKVAVFSSGLYGSISGSGVADVYSTGSFTIPLMKKVGYSKTESGAIEAVASAGGPFLPPVMGAGAFIMAEVTSTSYLIVIEAALLSGILYYIGVVSTVHFEAVKKNIKSSPKEWNVGWKSILKRVYLLIPFALMVYLLITGISPAKSAAVAITTMLVIWVLAERTKFRISILMKALEYGVKSGAVIASALAGAGMIVASVNQTGLALSVGNLITKYSFGSVWIALLLVMITVIILGAGIPATPAYVITSTIAVGALTAFNLPLLHVHMFIFYFAILADITPPVGVTAYAAANIAESPPLKTAFVSPKHAFAGFVVPYVFIANPELLLGQGTFAWYDTALTFILTAVGVIGLAAAFMGAFFDKVNWLERAILTIISAAVMSGNFFVSVISCLLLLTVIVYLYFKYKNKKKGEKTVKTILA